MSGLEPFAEWLVGRLAAASLAGLAAAALIWALDRALPRMPADLRAVLWWLVAAKMVVTLLWPAPIPVPILPVDAPAAPAERAAATAFSEAVSPGAIVPAGTIDDRPGGSVPAAGEEASWRWPLILLWLGGASLLLAADLLRSAAARRRVERAPRVEGEEVVSLLAQLHPSGSGAGVRLRLGAERDGARLVGPWRPVLVLPPSVLALPSTDLRLVLAHELAHVRRGDLWWGLLPALAERLFFFHPAAHLAAREYRVAREAACDAAVLRRLDTAPREYGRLLLRLGVVSRPAVGVGASSSRGHLKRRLQMLEHASRTARRRQLLALVPLLAVLIVPFRLVARDAEAAVPPEVAGAPAEADGTTRVVLSDDEAPLENEWVEDEGIEEPEAENEWRQESEAARADRERAMEQAEREGKRAGRDRWESRAPWSWGSAIADGVSFVLLAGDETTMHGSSWEADAARSVRRGDEDLLFVRRPDGDWVIRDAEVIAAAREIFQPQRRLGERQAELGRQQAALGERQAAMGAQQAELGARMHELGARQAELSARLQGSVADELEIQARHLRLTRSASDLPAPDRERQLRELEQRRREIERQRREIEEKMQALGREMRGFAAPQGELGRRQAALGGEQAALGARQAELGQAQREASEKAGAAMRELIERAIGAGVAERVGR